VKRVREPRESGDLLTLLRSEWVAPGERNEMLKSDYSYTKADEETLDAMRDRCHEQGHDFENCCSAFLSVYQRCKWCGETR
jgi:hypothetical protein